MFGKDLVLNQFGLHINSMRLGKLSKTKKKMKLFTTALLATAATAAPAEQDLADALHANYQDMPQHVQRRFWVSIFFYFSAS